jgi:hypothetical protein
MRVGAAEEDSLELEVGGPRFFDDGGRGRGWDGWNDWE